MFPGSERIIRDEVIPPRANKSTRKRNSAATQLPVSSNDNVASSSGEVYSFLDLLKANPKNRIELSSFQHENNLDSSYLPTVGKTSDAKPKKRVRSKAGPKSRKKGKADIASPIVNDEALDSDLFALVGSFDPNKSLDSDSSTSTLINEEINHNTYVEKEFTGFNATEQNSINESSILKNMDHLSTNIKLFTNSPKLVNKSIFSSKDDNQQKSFTPVPDLPMKRLEGISVPVKSTSSKEVIHIPSAGVSPLNVHNNYSLIQNSCNSTNSHSILRNLITSDSNSTLPQNYPNKSKSKSKKNMLANQTHAVTLQQNPVNKANLRTSGLRQNDQTVNPQSFYASMGLDEDLCDSVSQKASKNLKKSSKKDLSSLFISKSNSVSAPIKIETDEQSFIHDNNQFNQSKIALYPGDEMLSSNGLHVTMTFEAEPTCEEEEDDLPLSLLKNQMPANEITSKTKVKSQEIDIPQHADDIPPSMFIKKELIEDEIVSESEAVSSNLLSVSSANCVIQSKTSASSTQNDCLNVKIKTEPVDDYSNSESTAKTFSQHSMNYDSQNAGKTTDSVLEMFHKNKLNNNREVVSKDNTLNLSTRASENPASITEGSKTNSREQMNALSLAQSSEPSFKAINSAKNNLDNSATNRKPKKTVIGNKKSRVKITNLTRKNVLKNSFFYENEHIKSLSVENDQSVKLNSDSSSVSSYQQVTDTTDTESNSSKKKGKRKNITNESVKIDENVPITLLIKRKKTDSADDGESDSFLCTSVSKSNAIESQFSLNDSTSDKASFNHEGESKEAHNSSQNSAASQVLPKRQRKQTRKRQSKNVAKQRTSINSIPEKRGEALVIMDFEEQSPVEEIPEECNSTLSVNDNTDLSFSDNLIQSSENNSSKLSPVAQSTEHATGLESKMEKKLTKLTCSTTESTIYLDTDETLTSNSNVENDRLTPNSFCGSNSTSNQTTPSKIKKKTKRKKMHWGWSKKKRNKSKDMNQASPTVRKKRNKSKDMNQALPTVEIKEPEVGSLNSNEIVSMNKVPVVVIKNLLPEIKGLKGTEMSTETNLSPDQKLIETSTVKGKQKRGTKSRKRKKVTNRKNKANENLQSIVPECSTTEDNTKAPDNSDININSQSTETDLRNKFAETSEPVSYESSNNLVSLSENVSNLEQNEITKMGTNSEENTLYSTLLNKEINKSNPLLHSLEEEEIRQEIVAFEAMLQKRGESFSSKSSPRISETIKYKGPLSQSVASEPNILEAFSSRFKTGESNGENLFESSPDIQIKKEKDELQSNTSQVSFLPNTSSISSTNQVLTSEKVSGGVENENSLLSFSSNEMSSNLALLNKDFDQDKSSDSQKAVEMTRLDTAVNNKMLNLQNRMANTMLETSSSGLACDMMKSPLENRQSGDLDQIALSVKKEVSRMTLSKLPSVNFKDQHDLIKKTLEVRSENSIPTDSNFKDTLVQKHLDQPEKSDFATPQVKGHVEDDEIEILMVTTQDSKVVDIVDLTDDNCASGSMAKKQEISNENHNKDNFVSVSNDQECTMQNKAEKENIALLNTTKSDSLLINPENISCEPVQLKTFKSNDLNSNSIPNENDKLNSSLVNKVSFIDKNDSILFPSKVKDTLNGSESLFTVEKDERNCPAMIQICNSEFAGDKYINEYFKHPFPYSTVSFNSKQRNKNKLYTRNNFISWNLSVDEVESRLKLSDLPQFGKKLGDIVRLEKYPVSMSEVECYHRILGVAPSQKLLSKCFKPPEKNNRLNMFLGFQQLNKFEGDNLNNQITLQDVLQGITETKMMYSKNNPCNSHPVYERDCHSTETRDSCDSYISNASTSLNKNAKSSNILTNNERILGSLINDTSSNGRNIYTSSHSDLNITINKESDLNFTPQQSCKAASVTNFTLNETVNSNSSNVLSYLNLPSQETINTLIGNTVSSSAVNRACDTIKNSFPQLQNNSFVSNDSYSLPSSFQPLNTNFESNSELKAQNQIKETSNIIDVPVTELRKILETAGNLPLDTAYDQEILWKSKATFEYNHTHSVRLPDDNSAHDKVGANSYNSEFASDHALQIAGDKNSNVDKETRPDVCEESTFNANNVQDDSDDDYIDNEPMTSEDVDYEPMTNEEVNPEPMTNEEVNHEPLTNDDVEENSSHEDETEKEKVIPQYKSKWEKIMERKSLENANEKNVNTYMLKDCFPVSNIQKKNENSNISDKNIAKPATLETSSNEKVSGDKQRKKKNSIEKSSKQKDKFKANAKKQEKSAENSKQKTEKKKSLAEQGGKKPLVASKKKGGKMDDVSSLFVPDKPIKISKEKVIDSPDKSAENNKSKRFYGNRVTNRGSFLTESSSSSEKLKNIKIPKKKTQEMPKKGNNVRSEEFHSMIKSPIININTNYRSSYKTSSKSLSDERNNELFRSPLENSVSSSTSHYIRTKKMRDKTLLSNAYQNKFQTDRRPSFSTPHLSPPVDPRNEILLGRRPPHMGTPPSVTPIMNDEYSHSRRNLLSTPPTVSPHINDECSLNRKTFISSPPSMSPHLLNDESIISRSISPALTLPSIASQPAKDESFSGRQFHDLITQPSTSSQPSSSTFQSILKPENLNILNDIISAFQTKTIVPETNKNILPFCDPRTPKYNFGELNSIAYGSNEVSVKNTVNESSAVVSNSFESVKKSVLNTPSIRQLGLLKSTPPVQNISLKSQLDIPFNSDILHSTHLSTPVNPTESTHVPPQPKKAICLVPQHLKTLVGHKTIETHDVRLLMLEWSVDWLVQQQRFHDPPPISNALKKVVSTYDSFEDYYNTFFPLMLLETWHRIFVSWTHLNQASPYLCQIISYSVKQHYVSIECHTVFNTAAHPRGVFPDEGSILMVKYTTKSHQFTIKTLGYVTHVKTRRFNSVTDSKLFSSLKSHKDVNPDLLQILTLTFMGAYNSEEIDKREPIRIHVLCNVKPALKQNDALLYINKSPLKRIILNPVADGLLSHSLTPRNSPLEKVNECVREITKGILSPHPLPLLTVVRAKPESDRLNIIPLIIEKMKTAYKTKVLLCVRTVRALGDIAANICLHQSLKMIIINKRCDTNPQFQKYLLDEAVTAEICKNAEDKVGEKIHIKNEVALKAKKQILKDCDVVLSLIRNCHDEFLNETFVETDCVSQMCCIIDEANLCTEPESLIPILHGISKLILIGDPDYPAKVLSKTANSYDYSQSFFQRAYDLDLIT